MSETSLFQLLPAIHRLRDAGVGDPLQALLGVIQEEVDALETNIGQLYDDAFIETCAEWVVPYLGDLLGVRSLLPIDDPSFTLRGHVAHALGYRRGKGTRFVLEQLARDLTGCPAVAVEFFARLVTTQHVNHIRRAPAATADLRDGYSLQFVGSPFERVAHTADVRHIDIGRGRYNIPNIGLFLWRLRSQPLQGVSARQVDAARFTIDPLGLSRAVFTVPDTLEAASATVTVENVPLPLTRRTMRRDLAHYYGNAEDPASIVVSVDGQVQPIEAISVCDLSDIAGGWAHEPPPGRIALDPQLGRIAFGTPPAGEVGVSYAVGFPGDLGGGPYDKRAALAAHLGAVDWQMGVMRDPPPTDERIVSTLAEAVTHWNAQPAGTHGVIVLMESRTADVALDTASSRIAVPEGSRLVIVSGQWPLEDADDPVQPPLRRLGRVVPRSVRTHLRGTVEIVGTAPADSPQPGALTLLGVLLEGAVNVVPGNLGSLTISHATLVPGSTTLDVTANPGLGLALERSILGELHPTDPTVDVRLDSCIVTGGLAADELVVDSCTVLGAVTAQTLQATSCILVAPVTVARRQVGCVRYSWLPLTSQTPRRFRCQPTDAASAARIVPSFASTTYGAPDLALLRTSCAPEIRLGGEGETEMGAWRFLQFPRRLHNLQTALEEYLRFGLEAGVILADQLGHPGSGP